MTTSIEEALRSGAVRLVPVEATPEMLGAFWRQKNTGTQELGSWGDATSDYDAYRAILSASPDHTPALLALIEERDAEIKRLRAALKSSETAVVIAHEDGDHQRLARAVGRLQSERDRLKVERDEAWLHATRMEVDGGKQQARALAAEAERDALREALAPFGLMSAEGVVKPASGYVTVTTCAEYFHRARALTQEKTDGE